MAHQAETLKLKTFFKSRYEKRIRTTWRSKSTEKQRIE